MKNEIMRKDTSSMPSVFKKTGGPLTIDPKDILIPKILLMQGSSDWVTNEKCKLGEMMDSVSEKPIGNFETGVNFVPLYHYKSMKISDADTSKPKFIKEIPWGPEAAALPWEQIKDGHKFKNEALLNFYVMLENHLEEPGATPYLLTFKSSSYKNGRKLINHFLKMDSAGHSPIALTFKLTSNKEKNDDGTFAVLNVEEVGRTSADNAQVLLRWADVVSKGSVKIDNSDEATAPTERTIDLKDLPNKASELRF